MFSWSVKLYSATLFNIYNTNIVWIVFQEKYEIFRHLIKDNRYENNKVNKQWSVWTSTFLV
jgi:hypothetical protein